MQKFSSHVVEKCLKFSEECCPKIIMEFLSILYFNQLLQDPFANYVVRSALEVSKVFDIEMEIMMLVSVVIHFDEQRRIRTEQLTLRDCFGGQTNLVLADFWICLRPKGPRLLAPQGNKVEGRQGPTANQIREINQFVQLWLVMRSDGQISIIT